MAGQLFYNQKTIAIKKTKHILYWNCLVLLVFLPIILLAQVPPIEQWREHLPWQNAIQVVKGDQLYCATQYSVYAVDAKNEITRYSKVNGLNDIGVNAIGWDAATKQLVIAYNNSNLDILKEGIVKNIGDIKRSTISGSKIINHVFCNNGFAYLSSGLGIIIANLSKYEITDTWIIGNGGAQIRINAFISDATNHYAATTEGLKTIAINQANPANFNNWQLITGNGLSGGEIRKIIAANNQLIVLKNDSLFIRNGTNWQLMYADNAWPILSVEANEDKIIIAQRTIAGASRVIQLNTSGAIERTLISPGIISFPRHAIIDNGNIWTADFFGGLSKSGTTTERFIPTGPLSTANGQMLVNGATLYAAAGSVSDGWNYLFNRDGIFKFDDEVWTYRGPFNTPVLDSLLDFITLAVDPGDTTIWAGSYGGGLAHFSNNGIRIYKRNNSTLQAAVGDPASFRIAGLAFDNKNNLWVSNFGAANNLHVRKADGAWRSFAAPFTLNNNAVAQIITDDIDQLWIQSPTGNGIICYNHGANIDATNDDRWKLYRSGRGSGNLSSNTVLCMAKDKNGLIWVGTDKGVSVIQCPTQAFETSGCEAIQPVVQQDRFAGLLFQDETVRCIAVDGANRKWVGTKNGVWLITPEGDKIIYRFNTANSPLLDDDVKQIAIHPQTGEVFIATFRGICSFRSTATEGGETNSNVLVYPNPVPPTYNGTIAIKGLANNSIVKIAELNGRLVFQTRALGGQAVWDGKNYQGQKVAAGMYLVIARDDTGKEKIVTKIAITNTK